LCQDPVELQGDQLFCDCVASCVKAGKPHEPGAAHCRGKSGGAQQALNHIDRVVASDITEGKMDCAQAGNSY
jgi:hypothetical protein